MEVFVVLALALAVVAVGVVVAAAVVLRRHLRQLTETLKGAGDRVRALTSELEEETQVLALETEALQRRLEEGRTGRRGRYTAGDKRSAAGS